MITALSQRKAAAALSITDKHGLVLRAIPDTPIALLNSTLMPISVDEIEDNNEANLTKIVSMAEALPGDEPESHSSHMDEYINTYTESAKAVMQSTKEVVLPAINDVYESVLNQLEQHQPLPHNVAIMRYGAVADHPVTDDMMQTSGSVSLRAFKLDVSCKDLDEAQLCEMLSTGSGGFDEALIEDIAKQPSGFIETLYNDYFINHKELPIQNMHNAPQMALTFVIISLLALALKEHPPENSGISLSVYTDKLGELSAQARLRYAAIQRHRSLQRQQNTVIVLREAVAGTIYHDPQAATNTVVNGDTYSHFLEQGGSPEVIMGAALSGNDATRMSELLENQQVLLGAYERAEKQMMNESSMKQANNAREYTVQQALRVIGELPEEHRNADVSIEWLREATIEYIEAQSIHHFNEATLYTTIRRLMCETVFAHTQALTFLESMDRCEELLGGDVDPREAGYHALIDVVVASLLSQVDVSIEQ